jgi:hypothetical protein
MIVLGILIAVFGRMYVRTRAQQPLGMIVFSVMLFLHNTISSYAYFSMSRLFAPEIFPYLLGVHIAELASILIFLKITMD